jgi:hypothetical protein
MATETRAEIQNLYVHFLCKGQFEKKEMQAAFKESFEIAKQNNLNLILVDGFGLYGKPPTMFERYEMGVYVADLCREFGKPVQIAFAAEIPIVDPKRFGETVARNRGANGKVFTDLQEAKEWLQ